MKFKLFMFFSLLLCLFFPLMSNADQLEDAIAAIENEDFIKAHELLNPLAEQNIPEAQTLLGALYVNGQGVQTDFAKGLSWIMKAATQGFQAARVNAFMLTLDLANEGEPSAMYNAAFMCFNGWGGEYEPHVCLEWLENAGEFGHENSLRLLVRIYEEGMFGIAADKEKVNQWNDLRAAFAAGIEGKWKGSVPGMFGGPPTDLSYDFNTDGDNLTGTTLGPDGKGLPIKNGKIEGNIITFTVDSISRGMKTSVNYTGVFLGDKLRFTYTTEGGFGGRGGSAPPVSFTAERTE